MRLCSIWTKTTPDFPLPSSVGWRCHSGWLQPRTQGSLLQSSHWRASFPGGAAFLTPPQLLVAEATSWTRVVEEQGSTSSACWEYWGSDSHFPCWWGYESMLGEASWWNRRLLHPPSLTVTQREACHCPPPSPALEPLLKDFTWREKILKAVKQIATDLFPKELTSFAIEPEEIQT